MSDVRNVLSDVLVGLDSEALDYFEGMISDNGIQDDESMEETFGPFIESYGLAEDEEKAKLIVKDLCHRLRNLGIADKEDVNAVTLLDNIVSISERSKTMISETERAALDSMWGFDKIRGKVNEVIEISDAVSAKYERRAMQDQKKWLEDLEQQFVGEEDDGEQISAMTLPTLDGNSNEKDIHVHNFNITYGGKVLLDGADLRLVCGRRYGLVGRNGVGKTTLLKHMANFDIEGFPTHHRVLHVKQEVKTSEDTGCVNSFLLISAFSSQPFLSSAAGCVKS
jgi:ATP-binding cassette, subfamily F, member 3